MGLLERLMFIRLSENGNKSIGTRKSKEAAMKDLQDLEDGTHKSQIHEFKDHRQVSSGRILSQAPQQYAEPTRKGNYKGRGNNLKRSAAAQKIAPSDTNPAKKARDLIKTYCQDPGRLQTALVNVCDYTSRRKQQVGALQSKVTSLSRFLASGATGTLKVGNTDSAADHKLTCQLVGEGYPADTGRTL